MKRLIAAVCILMSVPFVGCAARHPKVRVAGDRLTLHVEVPGAETVQFASSLDGYRLHSAHRVSEGCWEIEQPAGRAFAYFFMVDGRPYRPDCRWTEADDFGSRNCLFIPGSQPLRRLCVDGTAAPRRRKVIQ